MPKMPKPSNSFLDKLLCSVFMTAYSGIGLFASIGVISAVKNNFGKEEDVSAGVNEEEKLLDEIIDATN